MEERYRKIYYGSNTSYLKMEQMRQKYRELFSGNSTSNNTPNNQKKANTGAIKKLTMEQLQEAEGIISQIEQKEGEIYNVPKTNKKAILISIIRDVKILQPYKPLPLDLAQKLQLVISSKGISSIAENYNIRAFSDVKRIVAERLATAISIELESMTESVEKLEQLSKMLTIEVEKSNQIAVSSLRNLIQKKISDLKQRDIRARLNSIPENISGVIKALFNGQIDIEEVDKVIKEEAKKRVASRPQTKFAVTEEQEVRQIGIQIRTAIMNKPDQYSITNLDRAITELQQLCGIEQGEAVRTVVTNLIGRKDYQTAKMMCTKFSGEEHQGTIQTYIGRLQEDIRNAEFGDFVLKCINMNGTPEELIQYIGVIEMGLERGNINTRAVSLGKSKDGSREITLFDIWPDDEKYKKETKNRGTH